MYFRFGMNENDEGKERRQVEEYLKLFCIEEIFDEAINEIIEERPLNPYIMISRLIQERTMPEILDFKLNSIFSGYNSFGIEACLLTNIGWFSGSCCMPSISRVIGFSL